MIQINLVPDIKQEMLRAQRMRNLTISLSILAGIVSGIVVVGLIVILGAQVAVEKYTEGEITKEYAKLSGTEGISNALTIQNQLKEVSGLNDKRTIDSRLLDLIAAINPAAPNDVKLSKVTLNPTSSTLVLEGSAAGGYPSTEVFRKTILNTTVFASRNNKAIEEPLTPDVVLQNTSYGQDSAGAKVVRFSISFKYPKGLFTNEMSDVSIRTPNAKIDVTDSKTRVPDSLFSAQAGDVKENQ